MTNFVCQSVEPDSLSGCIQIGRLHFDWAKAYWKAGLSGISFNCDLIMESAEYRVILSSTPSFLFLKENLSSAASD